MAAIIWRVASMFLNFEVRDSANRPLGSTALILDWRSRQWTIKDDKNGIWKRVSVNRSGKFESKEWGVLWLLDKGRNIVIVHDAPKGENDWAISGSTARMYEPISPDLKDTHALWKVELSSASKVSMVMYKPLPFTRGAYVDRLNMLFPAPYLTLNNDLLTDKLRKDDPKVVSSTGKYTTCGSLPGFVSKQVALSKGLKGNAFTSWMKKNSLNGTNRVRDQGLANNCWVEAAPDKKPKPGDIYVLLDRGKTDKKADGISHVGVFECEVGSKWQTFDLGQAGGFDGAKNLREYKSDTCELWGETNQGGGYRTVAGWVDLEKYFQI